MAGLTRTESQEFFTSRDVIANILKIGEVTLDLLVEGGFAGYRSRGGGFRTPDAIHEDPDDAYGDPADPQDSHFGARFQKLPLLIYPTLENMDPAELDDLDDDAGFDNYAPDDEYRVRHDIVFTCHSHPWVHTAAEPFERKSFPGGQDLRLFEEVASQNPGLIDGIITAHRDRVYLRLIRQIETGAPMQRIQQLGDARVTEAQLAALGLATAQFYVERGSSRVVGLQQALDELYAQ